MEDQEVDGLSINSRRVKHSLGRNWWVGIGSEKKGKRLANKTKVKGLVEVLGDFPSKGPWGNGTEIHSGAVLKTKEGKITVHLGPVWYFMEQDCPIKAGDKLEVVGLKVSYNRCPLIFAENITVNNRTLHLRDKKGIPFWVKCNRHGVVRH